MARRRLCLLRSYNSNPEVVALLLQAGADINEKAKDGWTPLEIAAAGTSDAKEDNSNPEVVKRCCYI